MSPLLSDIPFPLFAPSWFVSFLATPVGLDGFIEFKDLGSQPRTRASALAPVSY